MQVEHLTFGTLFFPDTFALAIFTTFLGIVVGALPGLTATMAVSLLVSLTYGMSARNALVVLIAVYLGGIYGGSRSAILLNVPGTPSSAATALDGFPLALKGEGEKAGIVVTTFSVVGGLVGLVFLAVATPILADFALKFGVWEYFWLAMFGVVISSNLASSKLYKGLISGMLGLFFSCVGMDPIHGTLRYTFGNSQLLGGITLVPAMIGLFGFAEALTTLSDPESHLLEKGPKTTVRSILHNTKLSFIMIKDKFRLFMMSSVIGTLIGALPGVGADIASWVSYDAAKRTSKEREMFGKGSYEGLIASETANNAATSGVFIPLLTLGIPGCAVSAIILGGIQLHGYRPGPTFFFENTDFVLFISGALLIVNIIMQLEGMFLTTLIARVLKTNIGIIMPIVIVLSVIGSYAISIRTFDITVMVAFGFLGFIMRKLKIPAAPMALGIILGELADLNFRRGLMAGRYNIASFFTRPISAVLVVALIIFTVWPPISRKLKANKQKKPDGGHTV